MRELKKLFNMPIPCYDEELAERFGDFDLIKEEFKIMADIFNVYKETYHPHKDLKNRYRTNTKLLSGKRSFKI
jgi:hypothetical protein